ncbi:hypothetical protein Acr_25g0001460 [Actinidia rufa]|uniref:Uncharacterized protein n=1 Tax=Actinidia rufa TaxID=165716 RepID=A0A7J0GY32_9ERIC|nr:hypothetical protein Acr_25g0001460 [Actinidia rufa]
MGSLPRQGKIFLRHPLPGMTPLIIGVDPGLVTHSPLDDLLSTMTQDNLDHLRKTYSFLVGFKPESRLRARLSCLLARVRWPFMRLLSPPNSISQSTPLLGEFLSFYNICPTQISPNAWRCVIYILVIWRDWARMYLKGCRAMLKDGRTDSSSSLGMIRKFFPILLHMKFFGFQGYRAAQVSRGEMSSYDGDKDTSGDGAVAASSNEGESLRPRDESPQNESPRDEFVEYVGIIKKEWRRILPLLPDLTMLRLLGGKVPNPLGLSPFSSGPSSDSRSESLSDSRLPLELRLDGWMMSKRITLLKLAKRVDDKKSKEGSKVATLPKRPNLAMQRVEGSGRR